jgi:hypothetical protein
MNRPVALAALVAVAVPLLVASPRVPQASPPVVSVDTLLREMADFEELARQPQPRYTHAEATSYDRESHNGGDAWFANHDVGQYVRTETRGGRTEHVMADLAGPGAVTRFWSANPTFTNIVRFYFDGEPEPRLAAPLSALFDASLPLFGPVFSYVSGTGGNLYFPLPFARSLRITVEESRSQAAPQRRPLGLYYEIGHRSYEAGTSVETFNPRQADAIGRIAAATAQALAEPRPAPLPRDARWAEATLTIPPNHTRNVPAIVGEQAVFEWSARVRGTREGVSWKDPARAENAWRALLLGVTFDGEPSINVPLGDFFGSGPGVNPYQNLPFTVTRGGLMTSRLLMPFRQSMVLSLSNAGTVPYTVDIRLRVGARRFTGRDWHLRAQWGALTRDSWPPFDTTVLDTTGEGKVVGTVYEIANPVLVWWGEGDQKVRVDGESFPSTFGTGTEDDYGFAYGYNEKFTRPYHAQTRVDGPWSGGHVSLNRWYVLDALPFRRSIRFDQEMWHWMPCRPTWSHVVYWYAKPGSPGPRPIDRGLLAPVDLGDREKMLEPLEGEALKHEESGGRAATERLANCSGAEHLVWSGATPGDTMTVHFNAPAAGRYTVLLNLCQRPDYGRHQLQVNGSNLGGPIDSYAPVLYWLHPTLEDVELKEGDNTLTAMALAPNEKAQPGNRFGLDYLLLIRK